MPTTLRNFRCDDDRWQAFLAACEDESTDASKQIRDMIDVWLDGRPPKQPHGQCALCGQSSESWPCPASWDAEHRLTWL